MPLRIWALVHLFEAAVSVESAVVCVPSFVTIVTQLDQSERTEPFSHTFLSLNQNSSNDSIS